MANLLAWVKPNSLKFGSYQALSPQFGFGGLEDSNWKGESARARLLYVKFCLANLLDALYLSQG